MNILASPLPTAVDIGGARVPIVTGHRTGIQVARTIESGLPSAHILGLVLGMYFPGIEFIDSGAALDAAMGFFRCGKPKKKRRSRVRSLDWDHDAPVIMADFRREYGIDLSDPAVTLHWWVFMAYFDALTADSGIKQAMYYRTAPRPKDAGKEALRHFDRMKRAYALPPKTEAEAIAREAAKWGDTDV